MNNDSALIVAITGSIATSLVLWWWLRDALKEMLNHLCPRPGSTDFWSRYTLVMLLIAPLAVVILFSPEAAQSGVRAARQILLTILLSQFFAFALVGRSLFKAVRADTAGNGNGGTAAPAQE